MYNRCLDYKYIIKHISANDDNDNNNNLKLSQYKKKKTFLRIATCMVLNAVGEKVVLTSSGKLYTSIRLTK